MFLELACFSLKEALKAKDLGVHRIEFCRDYNLGGVTPDVKDFEKLRKAIPHIPIHVMIRIRGGNFLYSEEELMTMVNQTKMFLDLGADGFVFGALLLNQEGGQYDIDLRACKKILAAAQKNHCVFHRAFDEVGDTAKATRELVSMGFSAILTSGGAQTAADNVNYLIDLQKVNQQIEIIAGGGLRSTNVHVFKDTLLHWIHSAAWDRGIGMMDQMEVLDILKAIR